MNYASSAPARQPLPEERQDHSIATLPDELDSAENSEQTLARLRLLWGHRGFLGRIALYACAASTLIAFLIPVRYESTARLMPPDNQAPSGLAAAAAALSAGGAASGGGSGLAGIAGEFLGLKSTSDIFVGILGSRTAQDGLIEQFDLKKLYRDKHMTDARTDLADHTTVTVDRKSQIISITVTDRNPQRAAAMAQAYVQQLDRLVALLSTSSARRERIFLEGRLQGVNQDLEAAEKDFSQFASKNIAIDVKEQGKAMVEAAAVLQGQLIAAQSQYEGLREIYTDDNSRVRTVKARIDELQRQLEKIGGKGESATAVSAEPGDSLYPSIRKLPLLGVTYADLYRRTKIQETVLETLTRQFEMAKVQEAKEIPSVKVLDNAIVPDKRSFPPRLAIVLFGTALAIGAGAGWVVGNQKWHETDAADPRKMFAQEVFSTVAAQMPMFAQNGAGEHSSNGSFWGWMRRSKGNGSTSMSEDDPGSTA